MNIEEAKKICNEIIKTNMFNRNTDAEAIETVLAELEKYDLLIEKINKNKKYFEEYEELIASNNDNYSDGTVIKRFIDIFQELLGE